MPILDNVVRAFLTSKQKQRRAAAQRAKAVLRRFAGTGELVGGILLLIPRYRFVGCLLLAVILEGAIVTHVINDDPIRESIAAPVTLLLVLIVAIASSPIRIGQLVPAIDG